MRASALLSVAIVAACHPSRTQPPPDASRVAVDAADRRTVASVSPARFSRPIAAAHSSEGASEGATFVAGLVVPRKAIAVSLLAPDGATRWSVDVIGGVEWSATATLSVMPAKGGVVVVWRGLRGGQNVTVAANVDAEGKHPEDPFPIGGASCATDEELVWVERGTKGTWLVKERAFGTSVTTVALPLPEDRDPVVLCGARRVFGLGDGDDDVTLTSWGRGARSLPIRVMEDVEFAGDDERGHEVYAVGDVLGLVRVGSEGSVAAREVTGEHRSPWRRFGRKLTEGDDVTLVDADAQTAVLAFVRDTSAAGDVVSQSSLLALAWERAGTRDTSYELAQPDPSRVRGPFWSGAVTGGVVVAWAERTTLSDAGEPPIVGMAYRIIGSDGLGELRRVERAADELVDAGCDDVHCYAVALARGAGEDGSQPEVAEVLRYP